MFRWLILCAVALTASFAQTAEYQPMTAHCEQGMFSIKLPPGDGEWCLHVCRTGDKVEVCQMPTIDLVPGPKPDPDDPIVIVPVSDFSKAVVAKVNEIPVSDKRHESALKLTATYQMLAGQVKDGKIHPTSAVAAADLICPIALGSDGKAWSGVFSVVNAEVGKAGTPEATAAAFTAAADAVQSTVPAAGDGDMKAAAERYGFDWDTFMLFLMELLKILLPLIIS